MHPTRGSKGASSQAVRIFSYWPTKLRVVAQHGAGPIGMITASFLRRYIRYSTAISRPRSDIERLLQGADPLLSAAVTPNVHYNVDVDGQFKSRLFRICTSGPRYTCGILARCQTPATLRIHGEYSVT